MGQLESKRKELEYHEKAVYIHHWPGRLNTTTFLQNLKDAGRIKDCDVESECFMMRSTGLHFRMYIGMTVSVGYFYHIE